MSGHAAADGPARQVAADAAGAVSRARRDGVALGLVGVYGVSFGAVAASSGFEVWQACLLSLVGFTGGSQFAYVGVVASGGTAPAAMASALLLGSRNTLYGLRLSALLPRSPVARAVAAHLVIDETTAMALRHEDADGDGRAARVAFWATGTTLFVVWNLTTLLGAAGTSALGDPNRYGLDAAAPAAFLALLWPRLRTRLGAGVALVAVIVALAVSLVAPAGVPVLAAAAVALVGLSPRLDVGRPPQAAADAAATDDAADAGDVRGRSG